MLYLITSSAYTSLGNKEYYPIHLLADRVSDKVSH